MASTCATIGPLPATLRTRPSRLAHLVHALADRLERRARHRTSLRAARASREFRELLNARGSGADLGLGGGPAGPLVFWRLGPEEMWRGYAGRRDEPDRGARKA